MAMGIAEARRLKEWRKIALISKFENRLDSLERKIDELLSLYGSGESDRISTREKVGSTPSTDANLRNDENEV